MRIIGGSHKRRHLITPPDAETTRPMPDFVREAVFNILRGHSEGATVVDVFAGTGSMGLEAASRGATEVHFIERDRRSADIIDQNIEQLGLEDRAQLIIGDALGPASVARVPDSIDLLFFDPPYPMVTDAETWPRVAAQFARFVQKLAPTGFAVLRTPFPAVHRVKEVEPELPPGARVEHGLNDDGSEGDGQEEVIVLEADSVDGIDDAALEAFERAAREAEQQARERARPVDINLEMPGAIGPESHAYGTTVVHLYMRERTPEEHAELGSSPTASA